jgi:Lipopolysaccharide kinase (Kdo/WaaP) family
MIVSGPAIECGGWRFVFPGLANPSTRETLIELALQAADSRGGKLVRRTFHTATRVFEVSEPPDGHCGVFFKVLDAPRGLALIKRKLRGSRAMHVARISRDLIARGINAPAVVLVATEVAGGREMIVTRREDGFLAARHMGPRRESLARKRAVLDALGAEVARLHRAGFVHGDLTPFNVIVAPGDSVRMVFIDHERTRRSIFHLWRPRLRNLVQLAHFDLPGLTNMDRMRVWRSYQNESGAPPAIRRRAVAMLARRIARDRGLALAHTRPIVDTGKLREG